MTLECRIKEKYDESETGYYLIAEIVNILVDEKYQRRHGLDAVLACCYAVLVHIHLDDSDAVAQHTLHLLQNGVHRLARLAPCSKEIDQNKLAMVKLWEKLREVSEE